MIYNGKKYEFKKFEYNLFDIDYYISCSHDARENIFKENSGGRLSINAFKAFDDWVNSSWIKHAYVEQPVGYFDHDIDFRETYEMGVMLIDDLITLLDSIDYPFLMHNVVFVAIRGKVAIRCAIFDTVLKKQIKK